MKGCFIILILMQSLFVFSQTKFKPAQSSANSELTLDPQSEVSIHAVASHQLMQGSTIKLLLREPHPTVETFLIACKILETDLDTVSSLDISTRGIKLYPKNDELRSIYERNLSEAVADSTSQKKELKHILSLGYQAISIRGQELTSDMISLNYGVSGKKITFVAGMNHIKFDTKGSQQWIGEFYYALNKKIYTYSRVAYSKSELFPTFNMGHVIYWQPRQRWGHDFSFSQFRISPLVVNILSKRTHYRIRSVQFTHGINYIVKPGKNEVTHRISARRYWKEDQHYLGLGIGNFAIDELFVNSNDLQLDTKYMVFESKYAIDKGVSVGLIYSKLLSDKVAHNSQLNIYALFKF